MFSFGKIFWFLVSPGNLLVWITVLASLLWLCKLRQWAKRLFVLQAASVVAIALLPLGQMAIKPLENYYAVPTLPEQVDGIIVLGGSSNMAIFDAHGLSLNEAGERLIVFAELARKYPQAKLYFTGGGWRLPESGVTEADAAADILQRIGMDTQRVIFENQSRSTFENGQFILHETAGVPAGNWLLITSASHMPRSMAVFQSLGWNSLIPYPVDFQLPLSTRPLVFTLSGGLRLLEIAMKEWCGLFGYYVTGKTKHILPARQSSY